MKIIDVYPKDVHVVIELSLSEVKMLLDALDRAELRYSGEKPEEVESTKFVAEMFYSTLSKLMEDVKNESF